MQLEELKKLAYMEGFVEDALEQSVALLIEQGAAKHAQELKDAWLILTAGIAKLRQENQNLQNCLTMARNALGS